MGPALPRRRAPRHRVGVAAVSGEHVVVWPQRGAGADRDGLVPGRQVGRALDQAGQEQVVRRLLGAADHRHLLVQAEQILGADDARGGGDPGHRASPPAPLPTTPSPSAPPAPPPPAPAVTVDWLSPTASAAPPPGPVT